MRKRSSNFKLGVTKCDGGVGEAYSFVRKGSDENRIDGVEDVETEEFGGSGYEDRIWGGKMRLETGRCSCKTMLKMW